MVKNGEQMCMCYLVHSLVGVTVSSWQMSVYFSLFLSGTQTFFLSHAHDKLNIPSFLFLSELKIYHLSFFIITHGALEIAWILTVYRTRVTAKLGYTILHSYSILIKLLTLRYLLYTIYEQYEHANGDWG